MSDLGELRQRRRRQQQQQQHSSPWTPFVENVLKSRSGLSATRALPNLDWPDIMQSHVINATKKLVNSSYVVDVLVDGVPRGLEANLSQYLFHPLHAAAAYHPGVPVSHLPALLEPAAAATAPYPAATAADDDDVFAAAPAAKGASCASRATSATRSGAGLATIEAPLSWAVAAGRAAAAAGKTVASATGNTGTTKKTRPAQVGAGTDTAGFDCNASDGFGRTVLHWASAAGQADWISALIVAGADPNAIDTRGCSPLQDAVESEHASAVRSLLEGGADTDIRLKASELLRLIDIGGGGVTPLIVAAKQGNSEIVRLLCNAKAGLERMDRAGFTALMTAVAHRHLEAAEVLLEHGADAGTESIRGMTPLMIAVALGDAAILRTLLRFKASPSQAGIGNVTPLHIAAGNGRADMIEDLLRAGADPSPRVAHPPPRSTPLHNACRSTRLAAVKALLLGGADETLGDLTPRTPAVRHLAEHPAHGGLGASNPVSPSRKSPTPLDVVGLGTLGEVEDPTRRGIMESPEEYARRRDPEMMEAIRQALRSAPADRAWRRRSWLILLRASAEAEAAAAATREKWELSSATGNIVKLIGSGLVLGDGGSAGKGRSDGSGRLADGDEKGAGGACLAVGGGGGGGGGGGVDSKGNGEAEDAADAFKRAKRRDGGDGDGDLDVEEFDDGDRPAAKAVGTERNGKSATTMPAVAEGEKEASSSGRAREGLREGKTCVGTDGDDGAYGRGGGGESDVKDDESMRELRYLCARLFDLAALEEGAFRRIVSLL